jgi:hypothetical protein
MDETSKWRNAKAPERIQMNVNDNWRDARSDWKD